MSWLSITFLLAAAVLWVAGRNEVLSLHRVTFGGRFPMGCVIAEALAMIVIATVAVLLML